jgi:hypothetical protein
MNFVLGATPYRGSLHQHTGYSTGWGYDGNGFTFGDDCQPRDLEGVGFKWDVKGTDLNLSLGFSHPVTRSIPKGLTVTAEKGTLTITGIDKEQVGLFANQIRSLKKPEPYKGL